MANPMLDLFPVAAQRRIALGVVHLPALPGAPEYGGSLTPLLDFARADAVALQQGGVDGIIVENFGDRPFHPGAVPPETIAAMAIALHEIQRVVGSLPLGANVLRNDAAGALALCATGTASFLRVNVHVGAATTDQGLIQGQAASTLRARQVLCPRALLLADVHVKHASPLGTETLEQAALDTSQRGLADALVVSGQGTGQAPSPERAGRIRKVLPGGFLLLGSGVTQDNARELLAPADGVIVASSLKRGGELSAAVDAERVSRFVELVHGMGAPARTQN